LAPLQLPPEEASSPIEHAKSRGTLIALAGCFGDTH
jgi:hypothetical protein